MHESLFLKKDLPVTAFLNTIILLGALQGLIISVLLFFRRNKFSANKYLAWVILLMSLACLNLYFLNTGWFNSTAVLKVIADVVPLILIMPVGPLLFFYVRTCADPQFRPSPKYRWHFAPVVIDVVPQFCFILFYVGKLFNWWHDERPWISFTDSYYIYSDIPRWISITVYALISFRFLSLYSKTDPAKPVMISWLKQFVNIFLVFQAIWLLYLVPYCMPSLSAKLLRWLDWYPLYIPFAIMIYWLGIKGYFLIWPAPVEKQRKQPAAGAFNGKLESTLLVLQQAMERDRIFLNPALNLESVAAHTGLTPKTISAVLNQYAGKSFNEWINEYRLTEFKTRLNESSLQQLTISGIASECGFNSQATFQRIFKQFVGVTPTEYLKSVRKAG